VTQKLKEQGHGIGWEMSGAVMGLRQIGQSVSSFVMLTRVSVLRAPAVPIKMTKT
jgi:hypothetical protein